jgi:DNA invertase Pin-like site-specific DNA recombinase
MKRGYARVSTEDQHLSLQLDALKRANVDLVYSDKMSGTRDDRPELARCLTELEKGDVLVVWRLDRLGRSLPHLLATVEALHKRGISFESLHDHIETSSATGRLIFHILASLAEFERDLIRERTLAGQAAARSRGAKFGPPRIDAAVCDRARAMLATGTDPNYVAKTLGISRATAYRLRGTVVTA